MNKRILWSGILLLVLPSLGWAQDSEDLVFASEAEKWMFNFAFLIAPSLLILNRLLLVWAVHRGMYSRSDAESVDATAVEGKAELAAKVPLSFMEHDRDSDPDYGQGLREILIKRATGHLRARWMIAFVASVLYVTVPAGIAWASGQEFVEQWQLTFWVSLVFLLLSSIAMAVGGMDYRARHSGLAMKLMNNPLFRFIGRLVNGTASEFIVMWLLVAGMAAATNPSNQTEWEQMGSTFSHSFSFNYYMAICVVIALHIGAVLKRKTLAPDATNVRLLVLRVFGKASSASFTFDRLMRFWQKFGVHFTIDDPSFARYRFRFFQKKTIKRLLWLFLFSAIASASHEEGLHLVFAAAIPLVLFSKFAWEDWGEVIRQRPVDTREEVEARLKKLMAKPIRINGNFRHVRMVCHMDTWKMVVDEFVQHAEIVLMDLRGYDEEKGGSRYEVNFLFDTVPIERVVFLYDENTSREAIEHMALQNWAELSENSPNRMKPDPVFRLFRVEQRDRVEVQALIDLLLEAASKPA